MNRFLISSALFLTGICLVAMPGLAFADCDDIGEPSYQKKVKEFIAIYESGEYQNAIEAAKPLFAVCKETPSVLFYTGLAFRDLGNLDNAKVYVQKASENLSKYSADPGLSRKIWFERYELEHPEGTIEAVNARKTMIESLTIQVGEANSQKEAMIEQMDAVKADKALYIDKNHELELALVATGDVNRYKTMMWTGAGIGIAGIVATIAGGAMVAANDEIKIKNVGVSNNNVLEGKPDGITRDLGLGLIGSGIGMTIVGTVMAGVSGYYYTHLSGTEKKDDGSNDSSQNDTNVSFNAGFGSFAIDVTF